MENKIKLIIDTDNGTDIDDICALYFALSLNVELIGIISSYQNSQLRALQIKHVLKLFGKEDVPVFAGCGNPIKGLHNADINNVYCQYTPELGEIASHDYNGNEAIDFLIEKAKQYGNELWILEIAPETTLAKAIKKDSNAFKESHIQIMGGHFYENGFEWNIECDYEAAKIIAESDLNLTYVGLDVCNQTEIKDEKLKSLFFDENDDEKLNYLVKCVNLWQKTEKRGIILYDPIAFLTIIDNSLCEFKNEKIAFSLKNDHAYLTISNNGHYARIAKTINLEKLNFYIKKLFKKENI